MYKGRENKSSTRVVYSWLFDRGGVEAAAEIWDKFEEMRREWETRL